MKTPKALSLNDASDSFSVSENKQVGGHEKNEDEQGSVTERGGEFPLGEKETD